MRSNRFVLLLALTLAFGSSSAWAFLDPPYITPVDPRAGELISVSIYGGECDLVDYGINWPPPVTQQGNELTILFTGIHELDPEFCYYGIGTSTYPVGALPPGNYTLHIERRYMSFSGPWIEETLGIIPFTVAGSPPQQPIEASTLNAVGLAGLLLALIATARFALRRNI